MDCKHPDHIYFSYTPLPILKGKRRYQGWTRPLVAAPGRLSGWVNLGLQPQVWSNPRGCLG